MKRKLIAIVVVAVVLLAGASWALLTSHYYKHGAVTSIVLDNQELLIKTVQEFGKIAEDEQVLEDVRASAKTASQEILFDFEYISRPDRDTANLDMANWQELTDEALVSRYGVEIADKLVQIKDFDGPYACFSYYDDERTQYCYVTIENQIINQVFDETDVRQIYSAGDRIWFKCYEKIYAADAESADFFYMTSGQPKPPSGDCADTVTTKNGWLYKSKYSMCYLEKITGQFYYMDQDGHDPV